MSGRLVVLGVFVFSCGPASPVATTLASESATAATSTTSIGATAGCAPWPVNSPDFDDACLPPGLGLCAAP